MPRQAVAVGDWSPLRNCCHENAESFAEKDSSYIPIHGWLILDATAAIGFVRFVAHSVVQDANGNLLDITPTDENFTLYPFIRSNLTTDDYIDAINELIQAYGSSNCLDHAIG